MHVARIAQLLQPFLSPVPDAGHSGLDARSGEESAVLSPAQLDLISMYIDMLKHWNARINLTAIRDEEEIVTRHFGESLFAARCLFPEAASPSEAERGRVRVADLGSGAGFPGIPMKLWVPSIQLTLIESNHKKATFLREVCRSLTLTDVDIQNIRGEEVVQTYGTVTLRAVENFAEALQIAARLMSPEGRLGLLIGSSQLEFARSTLPAMVWQPPVPVPLSQSRVFLLGRVPNLDR
ncbi:MAG TPA: 16S rRNA (guanine(527)-N(7))-methyltransferase RsmG [Candidatus Deferrimicrobiaceae bacterium]|nr:16S rRNA (guanine(527)-N(7))-methyltransferase RsmG [Candidatus Deferrimicrobiaceae bacterium]